jgi:hypothetical protein
MYRASHATSVQSWLSKYELEMSKSITVTLAVHTVPDCSILAQNRVSKVIARVPVASLWLLVLSNLAFVTLAAVVTNIALEAANADVNHVYLDSASQGCRWLWRHSIQMLQTRGTMGRANFLRRTRKESL